MTVFGVWQLSFPIDCVASLAQDRSLATDPSFFRICPIFPAAPGVCATGSSLLWQLVCLFNFLKLSALVISQFDSCLAYQRMPLAQALRQLLKDVYV